MAANSNKRKYIGVEDIHLPTLSDLFTKLEQELHKLDDMDDDLAAPGFYTERTERKMTTRKRQAIHCRFTDLAKGLFRRYSLQYL